MAYEPKAGLVILCDDNKFYAFREVHTRLRCVTMLQIDDDSVRRGCRQARIVGRPRIRRISTIRHAIPIGQVTHLTV